MESWEFLLQQEGSPIWTPITGATWELDEGRYRLMADASRPNFRLEMRVTHHSWQSDAPVDSVYHGFRSTNLQGLVMILPFTELKPGIWEVRCYNDLMSEFLGDSWQKRLQLKVLPATKSSSLSSDMTPLVRGAQRGVTSPADSSPAGGKTTPAPPLIKGVAEYRYSSESKHLRGTKPATSRQGDSEYIDLAHFQTTASDYLLQLQKLLKEEIEPKLIASGAEPAIALLRLDLNQDTFIRAQGESVLLSGTVGAEKIHGACTSTFSGKFRYKIIEPSTEEILLEIEEDFEKKNLPFVFNYALKIPDNWKIPLLAGEVSLETSTGIKIDYQSFTVTTDLTSSPTQSASYTITLSNTENNSSFAFDLFLEHGNVDADLNIELPEPAKMSKTLQYYRTNSSAKLPPKINSSSQGKTAKAIQLPPIPKPKSIDLQPASNSINDNQPLKSPALDNSKNANNSEIKDRKSESFQLLNLEERFISRLNTLAEKR